MKNANILTKIYQTRIIEDLLEEGTYLKYQSLSWSKAIYFFKRK